ncbi:MAG: VWA domain-containing protein, partial [Ilumatobacteraceae bacterium]
GGVPIDVVERRRFPHRPDLVLLCDVSGSVAPFAQFTLLLVNALHRELRTVRSFAFVDGVAEVTDLFADAVHDLDVHRLVERRGVVGLAGHSDYGRAFGQFVEHHLGAISTRTTVLICGDGRSNHLPPGADALRRIAARARCVYWLNPEPRAEWDTTDSVITALRPACREVFEVRTVRHLADVITQLV